VTPLRDQLLEQARLGPDPDEAPTRLARFCDAAGLALETIVADDDAAELLLALAGQSPYLTALLIRDPALLTALLGDRFLTREKDAATMRAEDVFGAPIAGTPVSIASPRTTH